MTEFGELAEGFLRMLAMERGLASIGAAYSREVRSFAAYLQDEVKSGQIADVEHLHIRGYSGGVV